MFLMTARPTGHPEESWTTNGGAWTEIQAPSQVASLPSKPIIQPQPWQQSAGRYGVPPQGDSWAGTAVYFASQYQHSTYSAGQGRAMLARISLPTFAGNVQDY